MDEFQKKFIEFIKFNQKLCLKPCIDMNTERRQIKKLF